MSCVILEPVQNAGGCFMPPEGYWQRVREICDRYGVLLISDEVICSWGRLGHYFGAQRYDYAPDLITTAKGLTSAYAPMGAVIASDKVAEPFMEGTEMFAHGLTFGGHPVARRGGDGEPRHLRARGPVRPRARKEPEFREMLEGLRDLPIVGDVRGAGFFHAIELVKDKDTKESFNDEESETCCAATSPARCTRTGLICRADDRGDPVIQLSPPLIADTEQFEEIEAHPAHGAHRGRDRTGGDPSPLHEARVARATPDGAHASAPSWRRWGSSWSPAREGADAPVRWVHITELPDPTPWLSGGELILTTGLQLTTPEAPARVRPAARGEPPRGPRVRHRLRPRRDPEALLEEAAGGRASRCSRCPTRCRSSRSPRRRSPAS